MIYNKLSGDNLQFAKCNAVHCEFTKRNHGQRSKPLETKLDQTAGNRSHGFPSRRHKEDPVTIVQGQDGQYKTRGRVKHKKAGCKLATSNECRSIDPLEAKAQWKKSRKARKRAARRRRGGAS